MPSLIPGYEYDIFISYRQKDNKGEKWVSEFVESLKTELESTFKEEISVYFDINPSDYLLETYDVDASLKDKLKCLVFIPIISRTYCDSKSFAWEHEFKAFVGQASKDQYGLKIKLPNGNVASRVLPIQIHDLKADDKALIENVLGGFLRSIEFIYTEPGVNRPLTAKDIEGKNINKTNYRNQINKLANSIDEIISALKAEPAVTGKDKEKLKESVKEIRTAGTEEKKEKPAQGRRYRYLIPIAICLIIIAGIIAYPKIFKRDTIEKLKSSGERTTVAVMPFQNLTNDTLLNIYQKTIQENLTGYLSAFFNDLKVIETGSVNILIQSKNLTNDKSITPSIASTISKKLGADIFIDGSIQQAGNKLRVNSNLIDAKTLEVLNSIELDGLYKEETIFSITDSLRRKVADYLLVSQVINRHELTQKELTVLWEILTKSPKALRCYTNGFAAFSRRDWQTSRDWQLQAIAIDSNFIWAKVQLSYAYESLGNYKEAKRWALNLYKKVDQMSPKVKWMVEMLYARLNGTPNEEIKILKQSLEIDDQNPETYYNLGFCYNKLHEYDNAIPEFKKALEIYNKWKIKPWWVYHYTWLGTAYHNTGKYKEEKKLYKKAERYFTDDFLLTYRQAVLSLAEGDTLEANTYIKKFLSLLKERSASDAVITSYLADIYSEAGILDKAEAGYRKALFLEPENRGRKYTLADFLIDKDMNIGEGLELVDTLLKSRPDNFNYLHAKGWGLYKQGNYLEAREILQKSWEIRRERAEYNHAAFLHLEAAKKAVAGMKQN